MASYRDPQLIPTLVDLIERAVRPEALRIVVCRQYTLHETVGEFFAHGFSQWRTDTSGRYPIHTLTYAGASIELIDVPHHESQGACWARNLIQQHYNDERYTLQLDSHHCFVDGWDDQVIEMIESLRPFSRKPVLTAYLPGYQPDKPRETVVTPHEAPRIMYLHRFTPEGIVLFRSKAIPNWEKRRHPVPARFYSAHFAFADGHFSTAVQHDPHLFFLGEEISIAARAFTHGYDLYHPHRVIAWHEYSRKERPRFWQDHTAETMANGTVKQNWEELDFRSLARTRALLGVDGTPRNGIEFEPYDFGTARTLRDYEAYAGVSFAHRGVQQALIDGLIPEHGATAYASEEEWKATLKRAHDIRTWAHQSRFSDVLPRLHRCEISARDTDEFPLHTETIDAGEFRRHQSHEWFDRHLVFTTELNRLPADYLIDFFDASGQLLRRIKRSIRA
ncbi:hypothetical protein WS83_25230 [Burkholderia sp. MSMB2042]|nr:hypothetical protein WS77_07785 [Burkholderia sp. MSMB0265]KVG90045.1 hypothetical protein WS81_20015 [Burkholderia sp. MSMB2040]KVG96184.1 hypothetical protein WS82_03195 [Burkholderia sp. MSMB2041]KVG99813.1 hypothetical protein WS83_25230 [Burkholderia sp. MSMB2042]